MGLQTRQAMAPGLDSRPNVDDFREDSPWVQLAKSHWLEGSKTRKVKQDVIKKEIWDPLEAEKFAFRSLLTLENLNILEKYARPHPFEINRLALETRRMANPPSVGIFGRPTLKMRRITMCCCSS